MASLVDEGVPAAARTGPARVSRHPQFVARGFYEEVEHPSLGTYPSPGFPFRFASVDHWLHTAAPMFGEHNHDVLTRILGLSDAEIAALEEHEVIGDRPKGCGDRPLPPHSRGCGDGASGASEELARSERLRAGDPGS